MTVVDLASNSLTSVANWAAVDLPFQTARPTFVPACSMTLVMAFSPG
ncbi:hypothetical protein OG226_22595 [Streptomyces sp. NBC_01261]|nr:hypothetical protein [Streptomyces sp. NBC_01261]